MFHVLSWAYFSLFAVQPVLHSLSSFLLSYFRTTSSRRWNFPFYIIPWLKWRNVAYYRCWFEEDGEREGHCCSICHRKKVVFETIPDKTKGKNPYYCLTFLFLLKISFYVFACSENRGDSSDLSIDIEDRQNNDFIILVCLLLLDKTWKYRRSSRLSDQWFKYRNWKCVWWSWPLRKKVPFSAFFLVVISVSIYQKRRRNSYETITIKS